MSQGNMMVALIHWRIKPDEQSIQAFRDHWNTRNRVDDTSELIAEFLSESLPIASFPFITWHLDTESLGDHKTFVTIGLWQRAGAFAEQVGIYFNDTGDLEPFEKYRRRRVVFEPKAWRIGQAALPVANSPGAI